MLTRVTSGSTALTQAFSPRRSGAPSEPRDQVHLGGQPSALKSFGKNVLGVAGKAALLGATAAAGWLGGGMGIAAATLGGAVGYGIYACTIHEKPEAFKAGVAGSTVGLLGGLCGAIAGADGILVMGALGACGSVIARTCNWAEGWDQDGHYKG